MGEVNTLEPQTLKALEKELGPPIKRLDPTDHDIVLSMTEYGYSTYQIAKKLGVNQSSIWKTLRRLKLKGGVLKDFKKNRADHLAQDQLEATEIQAKLKGHLFNEDNIKALPEAKKVEWFRTLQLAKSIDYDKERLELGKSTQVVDYHALATSSDDIKARLKELEADTPETLVKGKDGAYEVQDVGGDE